ncbi:MAG: hypothetical protein DRP85_07930 [Candidatus Makaraimicrobium thalassicum]|nr:MAG: hypothetical protein DRP85_07930 [Candidatus Omnitrophota bacterium]
MVGYVLKVRGNMCDMPARPELAVQFVMYIISSVCVSTCDRLHVVCAAGTAYEEPLNPEIVVRSDLADADACADAIVGWVRGGKWA